MRLAKRCLILALTFASILSFSKSFGQEKKPITDFYQFANKDWLDSTIIPDNTHVVNNWGILWNKIGVKSIEILSGNTKYELDEKHLFALTQLRNFYKSTLEYSKDNNEKFEQVLKHFPMQPGVLFSKITLPPRKEEKIKEIIKYLTIAYRTKIKESDKIDDYYKNFFLSKLDAMIFEIGSPDLSDFPQMPKLDANSFEKNIQLSKTYQLEKDKVPSDWQSSPIETDCFYNFNDNKVKIYAGILFETDSAKDIDFVYQFATLGRTIGHEMTHAFDNTGRDYDKNGEHINWFDKLFSGALFSRNDMDKIYFALTRQYNNYTIQDSLFVDGQKTRQENIADLGGVEVSLLALKLYLRDKHIVSSEKEETEMIKKYFINYAQFWREKATPEFERSSLKRFHTPQKFRAIGPIYNQDEFYDVFEIDTNSIYFIPPKQRVRIW